MKWKLFFHKDEKQIYIFLQNIYIYIYIANPVSWIALKLTEGLNNTVVLMIKLDFT